MNERFCVPFSLSQCERKSFPINKSNNNGRKLLPIPIYIDATNSKASFLSNFFPQLLDTTPKNADGQVLCVYGGKIPTFLLYCSIIRTEFVFVKFQRGSKYLLLEIYRIE